MHAFQIKQFNHLDNTATIQFLTRQQSKICLIFVKTCTPKRNYNSAVVLGCIKLHITAKLRRLAIDVEFCGKHKKPAQQLTIKIFCAK